MVMIRQKRNVKNKTKSLSLPYSEYPPWEVIQERKDPFTFPVQEYPALFISIVLRSNSSDVHIEILQMCARFVVISYDLAVWETLLHELSELIELLDEINFFVPRCCIVLVAISAPIHVDLEFTCAPVLVKHR